MKNKKMIAGLLLAVAVSSANASIVAIDSADSSLGGLSSRDIDKAIDGSGLSGVGDILTQTHSINSSGSDYFLGAIGTTLTFDLVVASTVDAVELWTYARTGEDLRGMQSFDISFSTDGINYSPTIAISGVAMGLGTDPSTGVQTLDFASQTSVTNIRIDNITTFDTGGNIDYIGISEIRFSAVPEPSTTALLGLCGLALILRRRK